jgi:DNA-binding transcriptional regulator/RsmH inhibitor MraZ
MTTKTLDDKGRLVLGSRFANRQVIVEEINDSQIIITMAKVVPEREAWLYKNPEAMEKVLLGLSQARAGKFTAAPPDLDADCADYPVT